MRASRRLRARPVALFLVGAVGLAVAAGPPIVAASAQESDEDGEVEDAGPEPTLSVGLQFEPIEASTWNPVGSVRTVVVGRDQPGSSLASDEIAPDAAEEAERSLEELGAERTPEGLVVTLPETILFEFDSAELTGDASDEIEALVEVLDYYVEVAVEVAGHTDSHGEDDYNQTLSEERARAVLDALVAAGASGGQLTAVGYGATRPVAPNETADGQDDPDGRQQNRRVEVILRES
jgi:photosystem I P700 chlorophyll a apoprotein A2